MSPEKRIVVAARGRGSYFDERLWVHRKMIYNKYCNITLKESQFWFHGDFNQAKVPVFKLMFCTYSFIRVQVTDPTDSP